MKKRKRVTAKLRLFPDPILTQVCEPVADGEDVSGIIRDMMYILTNSKHGVGLAAPQAGHLKRIIIISPNGFPEVMINPEIVTWKNTNHIEKEGCLSYPGITKEISRHREITICYSNSETKKHIETFYDFPARIILHEIDHLNGKCKVGEKI